MKLPTDIALCRLAYEVGQAEAWAQWLSAEERARWTAFPSEKRRQEFLTGRVAARTLLGGRMNLGPADVPLRVAKSGAVDVEGGFVSIAHAEGEAVAAFAERPVGVDLERVRTRRAGIERFVLHPDEGGLLDALPLPRTQGLILAWTAKEAVLKARRSGLRLLPTRLRLEGLGVKSGRATVRVSDEEVWAVRFALENGYCMAVAFQP